VDRVKKDPASSAYPSSRRTNSSINIPTRCDPRSLPWAATFSSSFRARTRKIAIALDGARPLAELLKNLPRRHMVVKTGSERWREGVLPTVDQPSVDSSDLYRRSHARWARKRSDIEKEIAGRQSAVQDSNNHVLHGWE
jgi:hypothetical protein